MATPVTTMELLGRAGQHRKPLSRCCLPSPVRRERPPERSLSEVSKARVCSELLFFCFFFFPLAKMETALFIIHINVDVFTHIHNPAPINKTELSIL